MLFMFIKLSFEIYYSLLRAITGSFLAAAFAGTNPAINVKNTLIAIKIIEPIIGKFARPAMPVKDFKIKLIGIISKIEIKIPNTPLVKPIIKLSAVKTRLTSRFDAPTLRNTPISFVRSITEIYVIIPIIIELTINETLTKAIKTYVIESIIVETELIIMPAKSL